MTHGQLVAIEAYAAEGLNITGALYRSVLILGKVEKAQPEFAGGIAYYELKTSLSSKYYPGRNNFA